MVFATTGVFVAVGMEINTSELGGSLRNTDLIRVFIKWMLGRMAELL